MKLVRFEEPVLAMTPAMQIEPVFWADGQQDLLGDVSRKSEAEVNGMLEAFLEGSEGPLKITGGKVLFVGSGSGVFAVEFYGGSRGC